MPPHILDGKKIALQKQATMATIIQNYNLQALPPHLAIIQVGDDTASHIYIKNKTKACKKIGIKTTEIYHTHISENKLYKIINELNEDPTIHGIIVQLPLPKNINPENILHKIHPAKDVDGFHFKNYGRLSFKLPTHVPATPLGILEMIHIHKIETKGKHCVIIGNSKIVGAPLGILMQHLQATVTICHIHTNDLTHFTKQADILISAVGKPGLITQKMVKKGVVIFDVGTTFVTDNHTISKYTLKGDVIFEEVSPICSAITPVPGGVGPMTVTALMHNTLRAAQGQVYTLQKNQTKIFKGY